LYDIRLYIYVVRVYSAKQKGWSIIYWLH